jgi:hypothetical protein
MLIMKRFSFAFFILILLPALSNPPFASFANTFEKPVQNLREQKEPETPEPGNNPWTASVYFENDIFAGTDHNYTNGVKLTWVSPDLSSYAKSEKLPQWSLPLVSRIPFIHEPGFQRNVSFSVGQNMYTPSDTESRELVEDGRPYAGWLYVSAGFYSKNMDRLDAVELQAGIVGPLSMAEETQRIVHEIKGVAVPNGWDHQLENEPGIMAVYEHKSRYFRHKDDNGFNIDNVLFAGGALGNVGIYANAGMEFRMGFNIPRDFGTSLIRPGGSTNAPINNPDSDPLKNRPLGVYLLAGFNGRFVLHDIFLDGNTFDDSHSVDKKHFVADFGIGGSIVYRSLKISYCHVNRTKQFENQDSAHRFGSISVSFTF